MVHYANAAAFAAMLLAYGPALADDGQAPPDRTVKASSLLFTNSKFWLTPAKGQCDPAHPVLSELVITWSGACSEKLLEGPGILVLADKANAHRLTMSATFIHGLAEGLQVITFPDGNVFEGVFHLDQPNGRGRMRFADGSSIEGEFRNDLLEGKSHSVDAVGTVTDATYKSGLLDGLVTQLYTGGFRTDANYHAGKLDGASISTFADNSRLIFDYKDGRWQSNATFVTTAGQSIVGTFLPPKRDPTKPHHLDYSGDTALLNGTGAAVALIVIASDGRVTSVALVRASGIKELDSGIVAALPTWTYLPGTIDGQPVSSLYRLTFRLGDAGLVFDEAVEK